jgi:hypothetical protein
MSSVFFPPASPSLIQLHVVQAFVLKHELLNRAVMRLETPLHDSVPGVDFCHLESRLLLVSLAAHGGEPVHRMEHISLLRRLVAETPLVVRPWQQPSTQLASVSSFQNAGTPARMRATTCRRACSSFH